MSSEDLLEREFVVSICCIATYYQNNCEYIQSFISDFLHIP